MATVHSTSTSQSAARHARGRQAYLPLAVWAFLLAPLAVLLHELGHWVAGRIMGYEVLLEVGSVSGGAKLGAAPGGDVALQAGAGPAVSVALTLLALAFIRRGSVAPWALALAAAAPVRFLVVVVALVVDLVVAVLGGTRGIPNFDEYNLAAGLAVPAYPLFLAVVIFMLWTWWFVWKRLPGRRWLSLLSLVVGAGVGLALWFQIIGPPVVGLFR